MNLIPLPYRILAALALVAALCAGFLAYRASLIADGREIERAVWQEQAADDAFAQAKRDAEAIKRQAKTDVQVEIRYVDRVKEVTRLVPDIRRTIVERCSLQQPAGGDRMPLPDPAGEPDAGTEADQGYRAEDIADDIEAGIYNTEQLMALQAWLRASSSP